ncbi:MAG: LacI family DNA-binding transcriptional regulator [Candidatus Limnocylindrales bacterium]
MRAPQRATAKDVATTAGVSTSTASRALSGRGYVSAEALRRVRAAAVDLGYVPDVHARNLRAGFGRDVGVMVTTLRNSFYSELATAIEAALHALDFNMILATDNGEEDEQLAAIDRLMSMRVAGIILTPVSATAVERVWRNGIRVVQVDRTVGRRRTDAVLSANEDGAYEATAHVLDHGHRHVAMVIDEVRWTTGRGRLKGFQRAHRDRGLGIADGLVMFGSADVAVAARQVGQLLDDHPELTGIVAANGLMAEAAFRELQRRRIALPAQMSLVAYDDVPWMSMVQPPITTVSQHTDEMGRACAELLVQGLAERDAWRPQTRSIRPDLILRGSVHSIGAGA